MNLARYPSPAAVHRVEEEIKRSRFITTLAYAPSTAAARSFIAEVSGEFAAATHNCWAYLVGPPGCTTHIGLSDDGEPHGTAGRPMLTVLQHSGVGDIVAVVTRFFGGTLLGAGGLVKAYSGGVQAALATLPVVERVPKTQVIVVVGYSAVTPLQRLFPQFAGAVLDQEFAADATFRLELPSDQVLSFAAAVTELTDGQALLEVSETQTIDRT